MRAADPLLPQQGDLQATYMDVHGVAEALGFARITVTTRSSPRVSRASGAGRGSPVVASR